MYPTERTRIGGLIDITLREIAHLQEKSPVDEHAIHIQQYELRALRRELAQLPREG